MVQWIKPSWQLSTKHTATPSLPPDGMGETENWKRKTDKTHRLR